jgi:hypothetical protein
VNYNLSVPRRMPGRAILSARHFAVIPNTQVEKSYNNMMGND